MNFLFQETQPPAVIDSTTIRSGCFFDSPGTFTFDLMPNNPVDDYDFAVYGPNASCSALGSAIRCSSTNPQAAGVSAYTGLNLEETDVTEDPGENGNGYLKFIEVQAGDYFYVLVDRAHGSAGFSVDVTGTAILPQQPKANDVAGLSSCNSEGAVDGFTQFGLESLVPEIIGNQTNLEVSFHESLNDANIGINSLGRTFTNTTNPQTIYYRVVNNNSQCVDIHELAVEVKFPFEVYLPQELQICRNSFVLSLSTDAGYSYYRWSTGEEGPNLNSIEVSEIGEYAVTVTNSNGCLAYRYTTVLGSEVATIKEVLAQDLSGAENTATVIVEGIGDYEFSLQEGANYQDENVFQNLPNNYYTVFVRDKNGCGVTSENFLVLDYPKFFTPNGDGYHDFWSIIGISEFSSSKIYIFDRLGKLLKVLDHESKGWDGTFNGQQMPASDYWFTVEMEDGRKIKGNFTLKN